MNNEMSSQTKDPEANHKHSGIVMVGLWIVALYFVLISGLGLLAYTAGNLAVHLAPGQAQQNSYTSLATVVFTYLGMGLGLVGGVLLLRRHRIAFPLLAACIGLSFALLGFDLLLKPESVGEVSFGTYIFLGVSLVILMVLNRKGVLWRYPPRALTWRIWTPPKRKETDR